MATKCTTGLIGRPHPTRPASPESVRLALSFPVLAFFALLSLAALTAVRDAGAGETAPAFNGLARGETIALVPIDVELFSLSAGGVAEPRADWTESAQKNMGKTLNQTMTQLGMRLAPIGEEDAIAFKEQLALHGALARAITLHLEGGSAWNLPSKGDVLDWTSGDAFAALKEKTKARYLLFTRVRDSYTSAERAAAMFALALVGVGVGGGVQSGYATLIDLQDGRVVWFNQMVRTRGDLRDEPGAKASMEELLEDFPTTDQK